MIQSIGPWSLFLIFILIISEINYDNTESRYTVESDDYSNEDSGELYYGEYKDKTYFNYLDELHKNILDKIDYAGNPVYRFSENTPYCKNSLAWAYVQSNYSGPYDFVVCTKKILTSSSDIRTDIRSMVAHEAIHVAQFCNDKVLRPIYPGININPQIKDFVDNHDLYASRSLITRRAEHEAYHFQIRPSDTLNIVDRFCL
tara:strand:+ start:89 stop:691 length:603 start_codon:yes stop_codon:yes gene_type:complete